MTRALRLVVSLLVALSLDVRAGWYFNAIPFTYAVGTNPVSIEIADLNFDNSPDVVVTHSGERNLRVLTNNGDGSFTAASAINFAPCDKVVARDVNGDARIDLIALRTDVRQFVVLTNTGNGFAFVSTNNLELGVDARGFVVVDLDTDGWDEIITMAGGPLSIFTNNHHGTFTFSTNAYSEGFYPFRAAAGCFNNDGSADLVVSHYEDNAVLMTNNGLGVLVRGRFLSGVAGPYTPRVADVNHDGLPDCLFNEILLTNNGLGNFVLANTNVAGAGDQLLAVADFNGDGWPEILARGDSGVRLKVRTNDHSNVFSTANKITLASVPEPSIADVNRDGSPDVIMASQFTDTLDVLFHYENVTVSIERTAPKSVLVSWPFTQPLLSLESATNCAPPPLLWTKRSSLTNGSRMRLEFSTPASQPQEIFRLLE